MDNSLFILLNLIDILFYEKQISRPDAENIYDLLRIADFISLQWIFNCG